MLIRPRSDWQTAAEPVTGPAADLGLVEAIVWHYPGYVSPLPMTDEATILRLRIEQHGTLARIPDGYSMGYNWLIDPRGVVWECRGFDIRCAANGSPTWNLRAVAVQIMTSGDNDITPEQLAAAQWLSGHINATIGRSLPHLGHKQVRGKTWPALATDSWGTSCPGPAIFVHVVSGDFQPMPEPPALIEEPDDMAKRIRWNDPTDTTGRAYVGLVYDGISLKHVANGHADRGNAVLLGNEIVWTDVEALEGMILDSQLFSFAGGPRFNQPRLDAAWTARTGIAQ